MRSGEIDIKNFMRGELRKYAHESRDNITLEHLLDYVDYGYASIWDIPPKSRPRMYQWVQDPEKHEMLRSWLPRIMKIRPAWLKHPRGRDPKLMPWCQDCSLNICRGLQPQDYKAHPQDFEAASSPPTSPNLVASAVQAPHSHDNTLPSSVLERYPECSGQDDLFVKLAESWTAECKQFHQGYSKLANLLEQHFGTTSSTIPKMFRDIINRLPSPEDKAVEARACKEHNEKVRKGLELVEQFADILTSSTKPCDSTARSLDEGLDGPTASKRPRTSYQIKTRQDHRSASSAAGSEVQWSMASTATGSESVRTLVTYPQQPFSTYYLY